MDTNFPPPERLAFFLGGCDLEMLTIRELLASSSSRWYDKSLRWGARASEYSEEILDAIHNGLVPVLVELQDDLTPSANDSSRLIVVDHHGDLAGHDRPTALEQVFALLGLPACAWSRWYQLVAANDRGHIRGLVAAGATQEEITRVRAADRTAQGITPAEEEAGRLAVSTAKLEARGRVLVVHLPHGKTATVTDGLHATLIAVKPENVLVLCPDETNFFGHGAGIRALAAAYPGGYSGGELPETGFWGYAGTLPPPAFLSILDRSLPVPTKPAEAIQVTTFRQILIWPLLLKEVPDNPDPTNVREQFKQFLGKLHDGGWREIPTLPPDVTTERGPDITFEEMVYFHPPVRDFLYGDRSLPRNSVGGADERPLRRLHRMDVTSAEMTLPDKKTVLRFKVPRVELYLCKPLVALLVVEVEAEVGMSLAEAMGVQSYLRQAYPPFFLGDIPGNCAHEVKWLKANGSEAGKSDYTAGRDHFARFVHEGGEPPVSRHWGWLLEPLKPYPGNINQSGMFYQQIEDDRIPGMTFLAVDSPDAIAEGDCDRLTFCDPTGTAPYPYAQAFLDDRRKDHLYERFWDPPAGYATRYLCSGYQFIVVGKSEDWFFTNIILDHFRRHYFRMGLILHFQRAALLKFADDLAEAIKLLRGQHPNQEFENPEFRNRVTYLQMTFLKFRSRAWFTEVSNQLQGRELFAWWMKLLGTESMFKQVDETSQRLYEALAEYETRSLAKSQESLANVATLALPFAFAVSVLAAFLTGFSDLTFEWHRFTILIICFAITLLVGCSIAKYLFSHDFSKKIKAFFSQIGRSDA